MSPSATAGVPPALWATCSPQIFWGSSSPQTQQCHLTPGLTAGDKDLGGTGVAVDVGGSAAVIPVIPGPCIPNFQPQGISGGGDTKPLAGGHLGPAGGHHGAIAVDGQGGRRVAVHRAEDNDQPATLGLLEEREGGNSGRICGMGEEDEVGMSLEWPQGKIPEWFVWEGTLNPSWSLGQGHFLLSQPGLGDFQGMGNVPPPNLDVTICLSRVSPGQIYPKNCHN